MTSRFKSAGAAALLGESLRVAREKALISRLALARELCVDRSQISKIERGQMLMVSANVQKLCKRLGVRTDPFVAKSLDVPNLLESRAYRIQALLGEGAQSDSVVNQLFDALEAFARASNA